MRALMLALVSVVACSSRKRDEEPPPAAPEPLQSSGAVVTDGPLPPLEREPPEAGFQLAPEAPAMADGVEMPPACAELRKLMAKLATCENVPVQSREALQQAFAQLDDVFTGAGSATRASLEQTCRGALGSMKPAVEQLCGP